MVDPRRRFTIRGCPAHGYTSPNTWVCSARMSSGGLGIWSACSIRPAVATNSNRASAAGSTTPKLLRSNVVPGIR